MMKRKVNALIKLLQEHQLTIAFAESMTCGLAAHQLTTSKGTSEVLIGGIICYHETSKTQLLNVSKSLIKKYTPESQQVTDSLAKNFSRILKEIERPNMAQLSRYKIKLRSMNNLLYLIAVILIIGWGIGFFALGASALIHVLLVFAVIAILFKILGGTRGIN